jgi:ABC-type transport system substrate-binding protein
MGLHRLIPWPLRNARRAHHIGPLGLFCLALAAGALIFAPGAPLYAQVCPKYGGTLRSVDMNMPHMDPTGTFNPPSYLTSIYDSLIKVNQDLTYEPGLAASMPEKVGDASYVFTLRENVKFHDGTDFNADAVKFALERIVKGDFPTSLTGLWRQWLKDVKVLGPYKVRIDLKRPWPDFTWYVASTLFIPSPTAVKKWGKEFGIRSAAGTGPFVMKSFSPKDRIELDRNPNYFIKGVPCLDKIIGKQISSGTVRLTSLIKGDLTHVMTFPESQLPLIEGKPHIIIGEGEASTLTILVLNTRVAPFNDARVRRALQYAVDGKELIDKVYRGRGKEIEGLYPPWHPAFRKSQHLALIRPDPAKARELLKEAGYGPAHPLHFALVAGDAPAHVERTVLLQAQLKAVGVQMEARNIPYGQMQSDMIEGKSAASLFQFLGGPILSAYSWDLFSGESGKNYTGYNKPGGAQNPAVGNALNQAVGMLDQNKAADLVASVQDKIFEDAPVIYLNWRNHREAWRDTLKNHTVSKLKNRQDWSRVWMEQ